MESFRTIRNCCISEFLGTLLFVFCGTASTLPFDREEPPSRETIGFAFGISFAVLVNLTSPWSCGYLNTAVTLARMIGRKISPLLGLCCIASQFVGGRNKIFFNKYLQYSQRCNTFLYNGASKIFNFYPFLVCLITF